MSRSWIATALTAISTALLPACDGINLQRIQPGITTAEQVRAWMGEPGAEYRSDQGSYVWEYSRQPEGKHCYMIAFAPDHRVSKVEQVLTMAVFAEITDGLDRATVRRRLGKPASVQVFDNLREEVWEWQIEGDMPTEQYYFDVHFDTGNGTVKKTSRRMAARG